MRNLTTEGATSISPLHGCSLMPGVCATPKKSVALLFSYGFHVSF